MPGRLRSLDPAMRDAVIAAVVFVAIAFELVLDGRGVAAIGLAFALSVPLLWRRAAPALCALGVSAAVVLVTTAGDHGADDATTILLPVLIATFGLGLHARGLEMIVGAVGSLVLLNTAAVLADGSAPGDMAFVTVFVFLPTFLAGRVTRSRTELNYELAARARRLEAEREERASRAAARERTRIAGELHDVVAHSVSSMVVQAAAARRLAAADPNAARDAIVRVEQTGRESLEEMRLLLGVLRRGDEDLALAPQPSLTRLDALVEHARATGRDVRLEVSGVPQELSAGLDVAAYRVIEEALEAAPPEGPAAIFVRWRDGALELEITADAEAVLGSEAAMLGLRERVALFQGEFSAPRRGPYGVRARLPLSAEAA